MEIRIPPIETIEVEIKETYIDDQGHLQERKKTIIVPKGIDLKGTYKDKAE